VSTPTIAALHRLQDRREIDDLEHEWRTLEARIHCSFFTSWGWIGPWLKLVAPSTETYLFRASRSDETIGLALITRYRYLRGGVLPTWALALNEYPAEGHDMTIEHNGLLCEAAYSREVWSLLLETLSSIDRPWMEFRASGITVGDATHLNKWTPGYYVGDLILNATWVTDISRKRTLDDVLGEVSKNRRAQTRRSLRHFESQDGPLALAEARTLEEALAFFDEIGALHTIRWRRAGKTGAWVNSRWVEFQKEVIKQGLPRGEVQLLALYAGKRLLGGIYSYLWRGRVYMLQTGFAEPTSNIERPGYVAHCLGMALNGALGMTAYDFLCGDAVYKRSLSHEDEVLAWVILRRESFVARAQDAVIQVYRRLKSGLVKRSNQNGD
jgi:CelD/BcsL family acetyltransferase involved in cellulose biosynthesis